MIRVCIGSKNPSKLQGIEKAFRDMFGNIVVSSYSVEGLVDQPMGLDTIINLARYRARKVLEYDNKCDFYVGVEAGFIMIDDIGCFDIHITCIIDKKGHEFYGFSPAFIVPNNFVKKIISGEFRELEEVVDRYYGTKDIGEKGGFISLLTNGIVIRKDLVYYSVIMALIPIVNKELYSVNSV